MSDNCKMSFILRDPFTRINQQVFLEIIFHKSLLQNVMAIAGIVHTEYFGYESKNVQSL